MTSTVPTDLTEHRGTDLTRRLAHAVIPTQRTGPPGSPPRAVLMPPETAPAGASEAASGSAPERPADALAPTAVPEVRAGRRGRPLLVGDALVGLACGAAATGPVAGALPAAAGRSVVVAVLWIACLAWLRAGEVTPLHPARTDVRRVLRAGVAMLAALAVLPVVPGVAALPAERLLLVTAGLVVGSVLHHALVTGGWRRGLAPRRRVVVAGSRREVSRTVRALETSSGHALEVVAVCVTGQRGGHFDVPVEVGLDRLPALTRDHDADTVLVVPGRSVAPLAVRRLLWSLERAGTHVALATGFADVACDRVTPASAGTVSLVHLRHAELDGVRHALKDGVERLAALCALVLLAPVLVMIGLVVRAGSSGPAIFRQSRVGKDGTTFEMWKFRTMTRDADQQRAELGTKLDPDGPLFKMREDPRVTRAGRWLRKYSVDELPQLVNVVRGEMAMIGPRPALAEEVAGYDGDTRRRLAVKPGMTGLWQVSGRSELPWLEGVRLDLHYVDNWSIALDVSILGRTLRAVLGHRGAY